MAQIYEYIGHVILLLLLLTGSAFFSGAETAFFSLSRRQINLLQISKHKLQNLAAKHLGDPKKLLSCLLLGNMTVNVLFYAVASVLTVQVKQQFGVTAAAVIACLAFAVLVFFGEILPKSFAYANSKSFSITAALPTFLSLKIFTPIIYVFQLLIVEPSLHLLLGPSRPPKPITTGEFKLIVKQIRKRGLITADETKLLTEIVELGFLKVRDCLRPRVDMIACEVTDLTRTACEIMLKHNLTKLPVYVETIDNIVGLVYFRQILLRQNTSLDKLVQKVHFVPELKKVESLLEFFRKSHTDIAIAVDEYGGIAGSVSLEDIAEELLGPIEITQEIEPIEQIGPFEYRLAANLGIHDWAIAFGVDLAKSRVSTVGGLVTTLLGKIAKTGDVARLKNLTFTVERMRKHRIETIILTLQPLTKDD